MQNHYARIQFMAANYSRLQGLREVPVGMLVIFTCVWAMYNQGDLGVPLLAVLGTLLLYWLIDRYYANVFGHIKQTPKMRKWELSASILGGLLALLAFWLDTARDLPFSTLGVLFAFVLFEDFWRAAIILKEKTFSQYPENLLAAFVILALSLLPLTGLTWWKMIGMRSQILGMLFMIGILIVLAGIWGHIRILRSLPVGDVKTDDNTL